MFKGMLAPQINPGMPEVKFEANLIALAPTFKDQSAEKNHLATFRFQVQGFRKVVCCQTSDIFQYLQSKDTETAPSLKSAYTFLKECTADDAKVFRAKYGLYQGIAGPGDCFYLPCGFVMSEAAVSPKSSDPCVCVRRQSLTKNDFEALEHHDPIDLAMPLEGMPQAWQC